jgi:hypothetical protein
MKTIEYKLNRQTISTEWFRLAEKLWNDALRLLEQRQYYKYYQECVEAAGGEGFPPARIQKTGKEESGADGYYLCCRIAYHRRIDKNKSFEAGNLEYVPEVRLVPSHWREEPPIKNYTYFEVAKQFTKKIGYDYGDLPSGIVQEIIKNLCQTWAKYQKGKCARPRYKNKKNPITSLQYSGFAAHCKIIDEHTIILLKDVVRIKKSRSIDLSKAVLYRLVRRGRSDYLQLVGNWDSPITVPTSPLIEISVGGDCLYKGEGLEIANYSPTQVSRIVKLQRQLALCKFQSSRWQSVKDKITKAQAREAGARKRYQQYHAQWLVDRHQKILITIVPPVETVPCPAPIPESPPEDGYQANGAGVIAAENLRTQSVAIGQFVEIIKTMAVGQNREVEIVEKQKRPPRKGRNRPKERVIKITEKLAAN